MTAEKSTGVKFVATSVTRWPAGTVTVTPLPTLEAGAGVVLVSLKTFHWSWAERRAAIASEARTTMRRPTEEIFIGMTDGDFAT